MKKSKFILVIVILTSIVFAFCQKRPFATIEVHGRIVNSKTNQPLQAQVQLWTGAYPPGSKGGSQFGSAQTNGDGSFDIKSKAGWNSEDYYIEIIPDSISAHAPESKNFHIGKNQNIDAGTIAM